MGRREEVAENPRRGKTDLSELLVTCLGVNHGKDTVESSRWSFSTPNLHTHILVILSNADSGLVMLVLEVWDHLEQEVVSQPLRYLAELLTDHDPYDSSCILSPCLFNFCAEYIMRNAGLDEAQAGINIARRNINNLRYIDDTTLMEESEEELKSLLMKVKEKSEKVCLKLNIQKTKIMASSPITSWQIDGGTVGTVTDFIFWGSKITAGGDCSHEIKRHLFLGRKAMTNLDSILKSRAIILSTKVYLVKAMVFPVVMCGCENWTIKKAEHRRIHVFELWCWRRVLRVPWTARDSTSPS